MKFGEFLRATPAYVRITIKKRHWNGSWVQLHPRRISAKEKSDDIEAGYLLEHYPKLNDMFVKRVEVPERNYFIVYLQSMEP